MGRGILRRAAWAVGLAATASCAHASPPRPLLSEERPALALLERADADGDGKVTRAELDAAAAAAVATAEAEFAGEWRRKLAVYGLPRDSEALDMRGVFAATKRMLSEADADHDGSVTPAEVKAYAMARPPELRAATVTAMMTLDINADMTVTTSEIEQAEAAFAKEQDTFSRASAAVRDGALSPSRESRLKEWTDRTARVASAARAAWDRTARDGVAGLAQLAEAIDDADENP